MSYEETLANLESLQKQFRRMELARQQRVNVKHIQRSRHTRIEAMSQINAQKLNCVQSRKQLLDEEKEREAKLNADRRERRRKSRLKLISKFGFHGLATGHHATTMAKQRQERHNRVIARKQELDTQKETQIKDEFKKREQQRKEQTCAKQRKKYRPQSAPLARMLQSKQDLLENSIPNHDYKIYQDDTITNDQNSNVETRPNSSLTNKNINKSGNKSNRQPLRTLNKNQTFHFMKPTLANYIGDHNCVHVMHLSV